jgi:diguanylate cyclase (GGDEF)-like protein
MAQALATREAEAQLAKERIESLARTDDVTGLPNRIHFKEFLEPQIGKATAEEKSFCVMFVDLDRFRLVNDTHGHTVGDSILQMAGQRIRQTIAAQDFVARLSADSFACVLPSCPDAKAASKAAERIMEMLRQPYLVAKESINLQARVGISVFPNDSKNSSTLLKYADTAMRRAKTNGKRDIEMFDSALDAQMLTEWNLHIDLSHAVERNELLVYYQPKISAKNGALAGYEALVRWNHPTRGLVPPAHFIPLAENTRLIIPIGEWVLEEACRQGKRWLDNGFPHVPIAVNVSAEQFRHSDVKSVVERVLVTTAYPPELLELEITEGVLLRGVEKELEELRSIGIKLSVDDFGTGYSSLSYLRHMPVSKLKVDQSFIRGITENPADKAITAAIVGLAKSLKLSVVAEGVETKEALEFLRELGCDEIQGYYYSKPLPPDEAELFCRSLELRQSPRVVV